MMQASTKLSTTVRATFRVASCRRPASVQLIHSLSRQVLKQSTGISRRPTHCITSWTRRFSSSQTNEPVVFPDPHRPDLFYHLVQPPTPISTTRPAFALSFLPETPRTAQAVIGWLPAETDAPGDGQDGSGAEAGLQDFKENPAFVGLLQETIAEALRAGADAQWIDAATARQTGWMHIHDQRNIPALDRIGDPDDIIGSVLVHDGQIQAETYSPMPSYRLCTADGVLQLTDGFAQCLQRRLIELNRA